MIRTILILAANPKGTTRLRLDQEVREIDNGLQRARRRDEFILKQVWAVRSIDFRRAMLDLRPNIVHFCGHGQGEEGIAFEDENGQTKLVSTEALAEFFKLFANTVECVILNACYSETQAIAIAKHIPYVIGMKKTIGDTAAIEFAVAFYDALGAGESIEFAYKIACNAIQMAGIPEHLTPVLKKKTLEHPPQGQLQLEKQTGEKESGIPKESCLDQQMGGEVSPYTEVILANLPNGWMIECAYCGGTGRKLTQSYKEIRCPVCGGSGRKRLAIPSNAAPRASWALVECGYCGGTGRKIDNHFREFRCRVCGGVGCLVVAFPRYVCRYCGGTGTKLKANYDTTICPVCKGIGSVWVDKI